MTFIEKIGLKYLHRLDPEKAHQKSIAFLQRGFGPKIEPYQSPRLAQNFVGLDLPNPVGLAAGYDKNAEVIAPLLRCGFGFLEVGAATPRPQDGNRPPRLFRLTEDEASINRFGFNNEGMHAIAERLKTRPNKGIVGLNLGANKDSEHRVFDYVDVLEHLGPFVDFATVNVSSPNTERLRDLQGKQALEHLLDGVMQTRDALERSIPVFLKIAPDLTDEEIAQIAQVARHARIDAIIATNTTLARDGLKSADQNQKGGLSGRPLFHPSTVVLSKLADQLGGSVPLIGVGGISSAEDAYAKICAGASAVQIYTGLVYHGISMVDQIARGLDALLERDGYSHISEAVGTKTKDYL